jgi:regulator of protease activity HflC (stomatin/prohibitin superfamily)
VLGIAVLTLYFTFLEYVGPNEFGIKEVQIGVNRGIQDEIYGPGYALVVPFAQIMHKLPRHVQVLEMTQLGALPGHEAANVHHDRPAKIQTSDGFYVDVDVSILYRIADAHKAFTEFGTGQGYLTAGVLPRAEPILKEAFGELTTEEFYNAPLRVEKAEMAKTLLNEEMNARGIQVDHVLIRYFKYSDRIQENIEAKKLQDQLVFTNQSKQRAAEEQQQLSRIEEEGRMQVEVTKEEGNAYKVEKDAERDLYVRSRKAEADLLLQLAEAESTRLRNEAMQVLGSDRYVAMEMAEVMRGLEFIVVPTGGDGSMNPLNLDSLLSTFGVDLGTGTASPAPLNPRLQELSDDAPAPDTANNTVAPEAAAGAEEVAQ